MKRKKKYFSSLYKGFMGECHFDKEWLTRLPDDWIILNDLELEHNNSSFQIDSLLIASKNLYLIDVKNFENDYYYEPSDDRLYYVGYNQDGNDALNQLKRSERLLGNLLANLRYGDFKTKRNLVFVNPAFSLYELKRGLPIVLPTQLERFMEGLKRQQIINTPRQHDLAKALIEKTMSVNPRKFHEPIHFDYGELQKGFFCKNCFSLMLKKSWYQLICSKCGEVEQIDDAVMRNVGDYQLLMPDKVITTNNIFEWCGGERSEVSIQTYRRILIQNMQRKGFKKNTIFI
ncbi:MAG: NERD domain-containing protein [Bacillus sp. (in: Bacteria)]|nr:NERD domain-containing protein [Bacillus sp. (in: firmicutes)]